MDTKTDGADSRTESKELGTTNFVGSRNQQLLWAKQEGIVWNATGRWESAKLQSSPFDSLQDYQSQSRKTWCGFRFEVGETEMRSPVIGKLRLVIAAIPYWWLVLPFTLLYAYLILWKPRKVGARQKCEPCEPSVPETTSLTDIRRK